MKIRLHPINTELEGDPNKSLLQICFDNKIELKSLCKGVPSCAECRVRVIAGESNLIPPNKAELNLIGTSYYIDGRRLACQIHAFGDISVDITDHLDKEDSSNKKIRGFRPQPGQHRESRAVQGTLVLQEGPEIPAVKEPGERPAPNTQGRGSGSGRGDRDGKPSSGGGGGRQQQGGSNRNRNQRSGGGQQGGRGSQGRGRDQGPTQDRNADRPTHKPHTSSSDDKT